MKDAFISSYQSIWDEFSCNDEFSFKNELNRSFLFQFDNVKNPDLIFIGINPSYNGKEDDRKTYGIESLKTTYFKPFKDIVENVSKSLSRKISWTHLDLLVFRETKQSFITAKLLRDPTGTQFVKNQLEVSKSLLKHYNPKVIVVSNALARSFLKRETRIYELESFGFNFEFSCDLGTDVIIDDNIMEGTPVFFTSMLSGQRALDTGSRQRLEWHIARVLQVL